MILIVYIIYISNYLQSKSFKMKTIKLFHGVLPVVILVLALSCQKEAGDELQFQKGNAKSSVKAEVPPFNLEVILRGEGPQFGHIKFRQDVDAAKIITLETWVRDLEPNHAYLLQRAVDAINVVDGNCTSNSWLTLGKGLVSQPILTDDKGTANEYLFRDITAIPSGSRFDIHFRVIDATTSEVVLNSDCYEYVVR
jgi:hypothetical protein